MHFFLEVDGVVCHEKARYWHAYCEAVAQVGLARTDEVSFWRAIRTGAGADRLLQQAKPHHLLRFAQAFEASLESPESIALLSPHDGVADWLSRLGHRDRYTFFSTGRFLDGRSSVLGRLGLPGAERGEMVALERAIDAAGCDGAHVMLVAQRASANKCAAADLRTVGIASGSCIAKRLAGAGALAVYRDLDAFAQAMDQCADELVRMGLVLGRTT